MSAPSSASHSSSGGSGSGSAISSAHLSILPKAHDLLFGGRKSLIVSRSPSTSSSSTPFSLSSSAREACLHPLKPPQVQAQELSGDTALKQRGREEKKEEREESGPSALLSASSSTSTSTESRSLLPLPLSESTTYPPVDKSLLFSAASKGATTKMKDGLRRHGKIYDLLGESPSFIHTFHSPKAMSTLGVLAASSTTSSGGLGQRHLRHLAHSTSFHQRKLSDRVKTILSSRSTLPARHVLLKPAHLLRAKGGRFHSRQHSLDSPSGSTTLSPLGIELSSLPSHPQFLPALPISQSSTSSSNADTGTRTHLPQSLSPPTSAKCLSCPRSPVPKKAANVLFGSKPRSKLNDRLGMSVAMMDRFASHPKAFQRLGLFDVSETVREKRMNVHGVVISGMRQLKGGALLMRMSHGPIVTFKKFHFVLTLDALTFYSDEWSPVPEGEISLLNGALVKRTKDMQVTKRHGYLMRPTFIQQMSSNADEKANDAIAERLREPGEEKEELIDLMPVVDVDTLSSTNNISVHHPDNDSCLQMHTATSASNSNSTILRLHGFTVTPLRPSDNEARSFHLLSSDLPAALEWIRLLQSVLRRSRYRSVIMPQLSSSRSSILPNELNYLHTRSREGYLFCWQTLSHSLPFPLSPTAQSWQARYVIVSNSHLTIFADIQDATVAARAQGRLPLYTLSLREAAVLDLPSTDEQSHVFMVMGHRVHNGDEHHKHIFAGTSDEEKSAWMQALQAASGSVSASRQCSATVSDSNQADSTVSDAKGDAHHIHWVARGGGSGGRLGASSQSPTPIAVFSPLTLSPVSPAQYNGQIDENELDAADVRMEFEVENEDK